MTPSIHSVSEGQRLQQELCAPGATSEHGAGYPARANCHGAIEISPDLDLAVKHSLTLSSGNGLSRAQFSVHEPLAMD